jgi:hypothetical protein
MELQRIALNMQISLTHSIARVALECASRMAGPRRSTCGVSMGMHESIPHPHTTPKESP